MNLYVCLTSPARSRWIIRLQVTNHRGKTLPIMCSPMSNTPELPLTAVQPPSILRFQVTHTWASLQTPLSFIPPLFLSSAPPLPASPPLISLSLSLCPHTSHPTPPLLSATLLFPLSSTLLHLYKCILNFPFSNFTPTPTFPFYLHSSLPLFSRCLVFGCCVALSRMYHMNICFTSSILPSPPVLTSPYLMWWKVRTN